MVFIEDTETNRPTYAHVKNTRVLKHTVNHGCVVCLPLNTSWSLSRDLTSGLQGLDLSLGLSCLDTKGRHKNNNGPVV